MGWKKGAGLLLAGWTFANTSCVDNQGRLDTCIGVKPYGDAHWMLRQGGFTRSELPKYCLRLDIQK